MGDQDARQSPAAVPQQAQNRRGLGRVDQRRVAGFGVVHQKGVVVLKAADDLDRHANSCGVRGLCKAAAMGQGAVWRRPTRGSMHLDVHQSARLLLSQPVGARGAQKGVRDRLVERWGDVRGLSVAGYGFAVPLLRPFLGVAERVIGLMPAPQGVMPWPADAPNRSILCDEARWPLANDSIDRLVVMHGLETSEHPAGAAGRGAPGAGAARAGAVRGADRGGLWARSDATPFGFGRPYSRGQIERLLMDCGFVCSGRTTALFFPPSSRRFWLQFGARAGEAGQPLGPRADGRGADGRGDAPRHRCAARAAGGGTQAAARAGRRAAKRRATGLARRARDRRPGG